MSAYIVSEVGTVTEVPRCNHISWVKTDTCYAVCEEKVGNDVRFICRVPDGHLVMFDRPGTIRQAADARARALEDSLEVVSAYVEAIPATWTNAKRLKALKQKLAKFDSRSRRWKRGE